MPLQRDLNLPYPYPPFIGTEDDPQWLYQNIRHLSVVLREVIRAVPVRIYLSTTTVTTSGTGAEDIATAPFAAGLMDTSGALQIVAHGDFNSAMGACTLKLILEDGAGTDTVLSTFLFTNPGSIGWSVQGVITAAGTTSAQRGHATWHYSNASIENATFSSSVDTESTGSATSTGSAIKLKIEGTVPTSGTVDCDFILVEYLVP